jgi:hypothetical protein
MSKGKWKQRSENFRTLMSLGTSKVVGVPAWFIHMQSCDEFKLIGFKIKVLPKGLLYMPIFGDNKGNTFEVDEAGQKVAINTQPQAPNANSVVFTCNKY